jgi:hypothetical protein
VAEMIDLVGKVRGEMAGEGDTGRGSIGLYYLEVFSIRLMNSA